MEIETCLDGCRVFSLMFCLHSDSGFVADRNGVGRARNPVATPFSRRQPGSRHSPWLMACGHLPHPHLPVTPAPAELSEKSMRQRSSLPHPWPTDRSWISANRTG